MLCPPVTAKRASTGQSAYRGGECRLYAHVRSRLIIRGICAASLRYLFVPCDGGDPLHENLNGCAARVVGRINRIKSEARKSKVESLDKGARGKVVGDDNIAE